MSDLVAAEWIKLRSVRSNVVLLVVTVLLSVGVCTAVAIVGDERPPDGLGPVLTGVQLSILLFAVVGIQVIGQEYRFGTIRPTFAAAPRRSRVLLAKSVVVALAAGVAAAAMVALSLALAGAILAVREGGLDLGAPGVARTLAGTVVLGVLSALLGLGLGALVRQPVAAIVIALVYANVLEPIIGLVIMGATGADDFSTGPARYLPFVAGGALATVDPPIDAWLGGLIFGALVTVLLLLGWLQVTQRDA